MNNGKSFNERVASAVTKVVQVLRRRGNTAAATAREWAPPIAVAGLSVPSTLRPKAAKKKAPVRRGKKSRNNPPRR